MHNKSLNGAKVMKWIILIFIFLSMQANAENISLCKKGWMKTQDGRHTEAIKLFEECIKLGDLEKRSLARTYRNIGIAKHRNGQFKSSIDSYNKALALDPVDPWDDYVNRGNSWSELGEFDKAFADYEKALELKPNYNEVFYNRGIVYEKQGKNNKAIEEFKKAYKYGLRSRLLYERFIAHGLVKK